MRNWFAGPNFCCGSQFWVLAVLAVFLALGSEEFVRLGFICVVCWLLFLGIERIGDFISKISSGQAGRLFGMIGCLVDRYDHLKEEDGRA